VQWRGLNTIFRAASDWTEWKGFKMKRITIALMTLAVAGAGLTKAQAGNREWATAGKVLTGVVAGAVIVKALEPKPVYVYSSGYNYAPVYTYAPAPAPPPVVYAPAPAPVAYAPAPAVVYAPPPTVVYAPAPVVYAPPPVVVYRPAYCPPPVVRVNFGFGGYHHHHRHGRW
jgi:hypothetical protein